MSYRYSVIYQYDLEGGVTAFVPTLPGCHTQGETLEEAEFNVKDAIALYIQSLKAHQESIPQEQKVFQGTVEVEFSA